VIDPASEQCVLNFFADCFAQEPVDRSKKPVDWPRPCKIALAKAEIEYQEHVTLSTWVIFKFSDGAFASLAFGDATDVIMWTTISSTIPSNLGAVVRPNFKYVILNYDQENYLVCEDKVQNFVQNCIIDHFNITAPFKGSQLEGLQSS
jgi:isoleucyl-tRNA synthetase